MFHDKLIVLAIKEEHIREGNIAIDATHFEARDRAWASEKKEKPSPKSADANQMLNGNNY
jgi:hypothetical protein